MTPEQFQEFLVSNQEATGKAIEKHVNGHIREMRDELKEHARDDKEYQKKIDDNITWVVRLIIGAVVLGFIGMVIQ